MKTVTLDQALKLVADIILVEKQIRNFLQQCSEKEGYKNITSISGLIRKEDCGLRLQSFVDIHLDGVDATSVMLDIFRQAEKIKDMETSKIAECLWLQLTKL